MKVNLQKIISNRMADGSIMPKAKAKPPLESSPAPLHLEIISNKMADGSIMSKTSLESSLASLEIISNKMADGTITMSKLPLVSSPLEECSSPDSVVGSNDDSPNGHGKELIPFSNSTFPTHRPSLAGNLRIGYFSMDRSCQTDVSDILDLKETTQLLISLVQDINMLKKTLYYAQLAMQADYEAKLENKALKLYERTNNRIAEIEKTHEERVKQVRHSFRTQLANAIKKMGKDYHKYYTNKEGEIDAQHHNQMEKMAQLQLQQKMAQQAQQDMIEMMKLQMTEEEEEEIVEEVKESTESLSVDLDNFHAEIRQLTDTIYNLEVRIEELEDLLEETNRDNRKLMSDLDAIDKKLAEEKNVSAQLKRDVMELQLTLEMERRNSRKQLEQQKQEYETKIKSKIQEAKDQVHNDAQKRIKNLNEQSRMREKRLQEQSNLKELMMKQQQSDMLESQKVDDIDKLRETEKNQRIEIMRLQKEVDRINRTWEMKVTILQQTIHSLKDEMFLRQSLQRQAAKLQHAAISYASEGPAAISAGVLPSKSPIPIRRHQLPTLIQAPRPSAEFINYKDGRSTGSDAERRCKSKVSSRRDTMEQSSLLQTGRLSSSMKEIETES